MMCTTSGPVSGVGMAMNDSGGGWGVESDMVDCEARTKQSLYSFRSRLQLRNDVEILL